MFTFVFHFKLLFTRITTRKKKLSLTKCLYSTAEVPLVFKVVDKTADYFLKYKTIRRSLLYVFQGCFLNKRGWDTVKKFTRNITNENNSNRSGSLVLCNNITLQFVTHR